MKPVSICFVIFVSIFGISSCSHQATTDKPSTELITISPNDDREYASITLDNQLTVLLVSDSSVDKSAAALSVGVGLLHDPMSQQGMAHYLEHMLFLGTERYPDSNGYSEFMSKNGGSSNAYTWLDITNYMFEINNQAYEQALDRFSDFFKTPKLYQEYVDKEKNAVNAEWSMRREMDFFGQFKLSRSMMGSHPANRFLIGNLETLSDKPDSKLHPQTVEFYNRYYSSNIMKVAMVSNLPIAEMKKLAQSYFSNIKNKQISKPAVTQKLDFEQLGSKRIYYVPNENVKKLNLDFTIENNQQDYRYKPNYFVSYLLGSEMPGTPAYQLKKMGLISNLTAADSPDLYGNYGNITISIDLTDAGMAAREQITKVVMNYINLIKQQGVDSRYFEEIKTSLNNQFRFLEKGNAFSYVSSLADEMQSYPINDVVSASYIYQSFNAAAINRVLEQLTAKTLRIWYISKQEPFDHEMHFYKGKYRIENISSAEMASWKMPSKLALSLPKVNTLLPQAFDIKQQSETKQDKPQIVFEDSTLTVWQYPSQQFASQPKGVIRIYFNNPQKQADIQGQILLSLWTDLFNLRQSALLTEAAIAGMGLSLADLNGLELSVSGFTDKQGLLLERGLKAMQFKVEQTSFTQAVDRYVRALQNQQKKFPISQLFGYMSQVVYSSGYPSQALVSAAKKLTPDDLEKFMHQVMANNNIRAFAFGNYDNTDITHFATLVKKALPEQRETTEYSRTRAWKPQPGEVLSYKVDLEVADVAVFDLLLHPEPSVRQEARAKVLRQHLRTATFDKLRTEEQLAYAVTAVATKIKDFTALGFAIQTPVKSVDEMQQRFDSFKTEYLQSLNAITAEDFEKMKTSLLVELSEAPKNLSEEQSPMLDDWYMEKWAFDSKSKLIDEVEKVTLADIKTFYRETALNKNAARLSIQLRGSKFNDKPFSTIKGEKEVKDLIQLHQNMIYQ